MSIERARLAWAPKEKLRAGWGLSCGHETAHHWTLSSEAFATDQRHGSVDAYESRCGLIGVATTRWPMFEAGNFPRCKTCERIQAEIEGRA